MNSRHRIMVVEDSETQALKMRYVLEAEGWEVISTSSAEGSLETLNRTVPDLILVDYHLPGIRGDELCRQIRMNVNTRSIPVLMLTVDETHGAELHGLESGADDYVCKSVDTEILLLRIRALLRKPISQTSVLGQGDSHFRRSRLLAIDDSPTFLQYLAEELESEGYQVERASNGRAGLERLSHEAFDCALVDLEMPDLSGIDVCRQIVEMRRTTDNFIVVLMLTARESKDDMTRGLEAGADDFVGKSSDLAVLKARIRALLRRKFYQEENRKIIEELKNKELEAVRARAQREAAEARAALAGKLAETNRDLEETNRKLKETQMHLIHSEKMASLGQLVAGIAHEINNPLAYVLNNLFTVEGNFHQITQQVDAHLSPASRAKVEKIVARLRSMRDGMGRVKELVLKLRTFSRLDEGEFKTVDIQESIDSVLLFLHHQMKGRVQIEKHYGPGRTLSCYAGGLNQVLMNLITNALDAIEGPGKIFISTSEVNEMFCISVRDTGTGIPEAIRNRIFEPFFTTKPVGQGTGLGLSISYGIVHAHGGTIDVRSEKDQGTEFVIRIPMALEGAIAP
jgi:two-component system, NtrC family, sensor kinase